MPKAGGGPAGASPVPLSEFEYDAGLAARAAPAQQEPEHGDSAHDEQAGARGQERDGTAVDVSCGGALLDFLRGRRALHDVPEVSKVLLQVCLRARGNPRGRLSYGATWRVPVVHLDLDAGSVRRHLYEAHLARRLHVAVVGVPADRLVGLVLGGPGVELGPVAQRSLDDPVGGVRARRAYVFDVLHELRQVLQGLPVVIDILYRSPYFHTRFDTLRHLSSCADYNHPSGLFTPVANG